MHNQMATQSLVLPVLGHINLSVTFVGPPTHRHTHTHKYLNSKDTHRGTHMHIHLHTKHTEEHTSYFFMLVDTDNLGFC